MNSPVNIQDLINTIAVETMKRHGYKISINDIDSDNCKNNPVIQRYFSDAKATIDVVNKFVIENDFSFSDLDLKENCSTDESNDRESLFPTWEDIKKWTDLLYDFWGCTKFDRFLFEQNEHDKVEALKAYMTPQEIARFYKHLTDNKEYSCEANKHDVTDLAKAIIKMLNPYGNKIQASLYFNDSMLCVGGRCCDAWARKWHGEYSREIDTLLPPGLNPIGMSLTEILNYHKNCETSINKSVDKAKSVDGVELDRQNKPVKTAEMQLYFGSRNLCIGLRVVEGVHGGNFATDYKGMFIYSIFAQVESDINPIGKHINEFVENGISSDKTPHHTDFEDLTKSERDLLNCFVGREVEFERFRVIKEELFWTNNIKVGKLIDSQSDCKGWYLTSGKDKAALYWTPSNGWEVGTRKNQDKLTGVFEDFDLIQALEVNDTQVNGISANDWNNARDEEAELEAIARNQFM